MNRIQISVQDPKSYAHYSASKMAKCRKPAGVHLLHILTNLKKCPDFTQISSLLTFIENKLYIVYTCSNPRMTMITSVWFN